ncbi:unnamed protein product [Mesocestoides corti]|uniref:Uncharacterized protein n=1 Tax=Mesocestoides corti TaxID=53468 RepID=A0A0R3U9W0_MESCO|nr:unnamed protein product [Mesocestoides corti]
MSKVASRCQNWRCVIATQIHLRLREHEGATRHTNPPATRKLSNRQWKKSSEIFDSSFRLGGTFSLPPLAPLHSSFSSACVTYPPFYQHSDGMEFTFNTFARVTLANALFAWLCAKSDTHGRGEGEGEKNPPFNPHPPPLSGREDLKGPLSRYRKPQKACVRACVRTQVRRCDHVNGAQVAAHVCGGKKEARFLRWPSGDKWTA